MDKVPPIKCCDHCKSSQQATKKESNTIPSKSNSAPVAALAKEVPTAASLNSQQQLVSTTPANLPKQSSPSNTVPRMPLNNQSNSTAPQSGMSSSQAPETGQSQVSFQTAVSAPSTSSSAQPPLQSQPQSQPANGSTFSAQSSQASSNQQQSPVLTQPSSQPNVTQPNSTIQSTATQGARQSAANQSYAQPSESQVSSQSQTSTSASTQQATSSSQSVTSSSSSVNSSATTMTQQPSQTISTAPAAVSTNAAQVAAAASKGQSPVAAHSQATGKGTALSMPQSSRVSAMAANTVAKPTNNVNISSSNAGKGTSIQQNIQTLNVVLQKFNGPELQAAMAKLTQMSNNPQTAQTALKLSSSMVALAKSFHPQAAANIAKAIPNVQPQTMPAFTALVDTLPTLNVKPAGMVMITTVIGNVAQNLTPQVTKAVTDVLQTLSNMGKLDSIANDLNKMAALQALLAVSTSSKDVNVDKLLELLGPIIATATGNNEDDKKKRLEQKQALENMINFLEDYVSTGAAIWAEQLNINKEMKRLEEEKASAEKQLKRQMLLLQQQDVQENGAFNLDPDTNDNFFHQSQVPVLAF